MLTDEQIIGTIDAKVAQAKESAKGHTIIFGILTLVTAIIISLVLSRNKNITGDYERHLDSLQKELVMLKRDRAQDSVNSIRIQHDLDSFKTERKSLTGQIDRLDRNLISISHQYEKIPDYSKLSDDSLSSEFSKRFNY
jgi:hypothetical protein